MKSLLDWNRNCKAHRVALGLLLALLPAGSTITVAQNPGPKPRPAQPGRTDAAVTDDPAEPIRRRNPRTEEDEDRIHSSTLYAYGRVLQQRREFESALRQFERAWRYHPAGVSIASEIVPLAAALNRRAEAARYAVLTPDSEPFDRRLLMALGAALSEEGDFHGAIKLYEAALKQETDRQAGVSTVLLWLECGRLYFLTEQFDKSADVFARAREAIEEENKLVLPEEVRKRLLGDAERTYGVMAESFLLAGRFDLAESAVDRAFPGDANKPRRLSQLARIALRRGDADGAISRLDEYFETGSQDAGDEPYETLAEAVAKKFDDEGSALDDLLHRLRTLHEASPDDPLRAAALAEQLISAERYDGVAPLLESVIAKSPSDELFAVLVRVHRQRKDAAALLDAMSRAVAFTGDSGPIASVARSLADDAERADAERAGDVKLTEELLKLAREKIAAEPSSLPEGVAFAGAVVARETSRWEDFDLLADAALRSEKPAPEAIVVGLGLELLRADQAERSAAMFQRALDDNLKPDSVGVLHFYRSGALVLAERFDESLDAAKDAAKSNADSPDFAQRVGWVHYQARRYTEAEKEYEAFVDKFDERKESPMRDALRQARLILSALCVQQDRPADAEEWLEQVLDEFPEDVGAMNDLGYLWADQGKRLQRAQAMSEKAVAAEPDNAAYRDTLGWVYFRLGRFEDAAAELELAAAEDNPDGVILDHLGDVLIKLGRKEDAAEHWRRAAEAFEREHETKRRDAAEAKLRQLDGE